MVPVNTTQTWSKLSNFEDFSRPTKFYISLAYWCICATTIAALVAEKKRFNRKQRIPKASWFGVRIPFIDGFYTPFKLRNEGVKIFEELASKYGHIYELPFAQMKTIMVSDAEVIQKIMTSNNPNHLNKPKYIYGKVFENILSEGLFMVENQTWIHHRSITNRTFNYGHLKLYLKSMNNHASALVCKIQNELLDRASVDFHIVKDLIDFHALGMVAETLWGPIVYSDEVTLNAKRSIHRAKELTMFRFMHPEFFVETLWNLHPKKWELDKLWKNFICTLQEIVETHKRNMKTVKDDGGIGEKPVRYMVEDMLASGMADDEIYSEVATFLIAGFETTGISLTLLLFHLAANPDVQSKCREEVDSILNKKQCLSDDTFGNLTMEDLSNLKYIERCLLESLRITTAVPIFSRRLDEPLRINDSLELKAGENIIMLPWVLHRDSKHYPNPLTFDPDRFLPENMKKRDPYAFVPFAGGSRNCVGKKFAMMEVKLMLAFILREFEVTTEDKLEDLKFMVEASLRPERNIRMTLVKRK